MADRYDITVPRKRGEKTYWHRIGAAFPAKSGEGFNLIFDSLPVPDEKGEVRASLFPAKPKEQPSSGYQGLDDDIPL